MGGAIYPRAIDLLDIAGVTKAKQSKSHGKLFHALYRVVGDLMADQDLDGKIDLISIEDETGRGEATSAMLSGYRAIVKLRAEYDGQLPPAKPTAATPLPASRNAAAIPQKRELPATRRQLPRNSHFSVIIYLCCDFSRLRPKSLR